MKIWITGIAGFLGSHLADALIADGHEVSGNDNLICGDRNNFTSSYIIPPDNFNEENFHSIKDEKDLVNILKSGDWRSIELHEIDCCHSSAIRDLLNGFKPDTLIHCAATAHEGLSIFSPSFITRNIFEASVSTFSAAIAAGVKRIIYMSSMSRYGKGEPDYKKSFNREINVNQFGPPFIENSQGTYPVDPYGIAKVAAEECLRVLCATHGVNYAIAVPHNIIGIRQRSVDPYRNVAAIMINRCKQGKPPIIYGDGSQMRCFSPVKDCIPSLLRMVEGAADGEVVNIGPDMGKISIKSLAYRIMRLTEFKGDPIYMPGRPNEVSKAYTCSDKARRLLGYQEQQNLTDCLKEMVDYIQPAPFVYDFPLEIVSDKTPKTWVERLM